VGANERLIGSVVRQRRNEVFLATKCGILGAVAPGAPSGLDGSPAEITRSCDASLERLGVEVIDLFYLHRVDPKTPIEESVGAMARLVEVGKVRYLGLSEAGPSTLRRACAVHPIAALQSEYSLWWREPEARLLSTCRELGIAFVPFSPLGRGFLSGTVTSLDALKPGDMRLTLPRFQGESLDHNLRLVAPLEAMARAKGCAASQLALAWLLARGDDIVPIPGTKRRTYLESNVASTELALSADDVAALNDTFTPDAAVGERYQPEYMKWVDRA
jgi:aryl-alcohol dehydrogenase-like predicted oxidoreductase